MADTRISLKYNLKQLDNEHNNAHLLWFPKAVRTDTLNLRGLSDHISDHGSIYTRDVVQGVLTKFTMCMIELLKQGVAVKLDGLGTFHMELESKGAESPVGYNINDYLKGAHIRFAPEHSELDRITAPTMKKLIQFQQNMIFDRYGKPKKVVDGQVVDYTGDDDGSDDNTDDNNNNEG